MSGVKMPEPVAVAFLAECGNVAYTGHLEGPYRQLRALSADGRRGASLGLITTEQAEAYAAAKVREALEQAIAICQAEGDEWDSDSVEIEKNYAHAARDRIRALIPPLPGPVEP